jgi:predicted SnoaL-like aldol condensation-catalyzing enzyme
VDADRRAFFERFVDLMYREKNIPDAFDTFVAADYVQHNPGIPDGRSAARDVLAPMFADPGFNPEVQRLVVDGDMCAVHLRIVRDSRPVAAVVDLYRAEGGAVVEHWDVIQPWPQESANDHPMF